MKRQQKTLERMTKRLKELKDNFDEFLDHFDKTRIFSGPSLYFHKKVIDILRKKGLSGVLEDELFFEYLYATLASWGLHRMGKTNTKLVDFDKFKQSITWQKDRILILADKKITELSTSIPATKQLRELIEDLEIGEGETKLVFNSKTMHHLLPDLMPPIDRQYILLFFYNSISPSRIEDCFSEIFPRFIEIAVQKKDTIHKRVGKGFNTSETKVIDNAIVGYVLKNDLKGQKNKK